MFFCWILSISLNSRICCFYERFLRVEWSRNVFQMRDNQWGIHHHLTALLSQSLGKFVILIGSVSIIYDKHFIIQIVIISLEWSMQIKFSLYFYFGCIIYFIMRFGWYRQVKWAEEQAEHDGIVCQYLVCYQIKIIDITLLYLYR